MEIVKADVVMSVRGRDSGELFYVMQSDGEYALIVNGRDRRLEKPKKKKLKHLQFVESGEGRAAQKLREGERLANSEIRRELASKAASLEVKGGMHIGEGRHD
ncbi:MAG: hypothetical protein ACI3VB_05640 [Oscillospiraceae bacterium]